MNVESVASVSLNVRPDGATLSLCRAALGLSFEGGDGDYVFTERLPGVKHLGVWPLRDAAKACFGTDEWPQDLALPQASIEFEVSSVDDVASAAAELRAQGHAVLHDARQEPWGQTITRVLTDEGMIVGVAYTPWFHG